MNLTIQITSTKIIFACLVDDGLAMTSHICDLVKAIIHVSVVFFLVKTPSTHYQGSVLLTKRLVCLQFYLKTINIKWLFSICLEISQVYENSWSCCSHVMVTLMISPFVNWSIDFVTNCKIGLHLCWGWKRQSLPSRGHVTEVAIPRPATT